jgi:hypothetical protein
VLQKSNDALLTVFGEISAHLHLSKEAKARCAYDPQSHDDRASQSPDAIDESRTRWL